MKKKNLQLRILIKAMMTGLLLLVAGITDAMALSFTINNLRYTVNNDGTSVTVYGLAQDVSASGSLVIPESVTYNGISYSVIAIRNEAFYDCSGFTGSLIIPNSVTLIGESAFEDCSGFSGSLIIPNSVTMISHYAFRNCSGFMGHLIIGNSVTTIGMSAFQNCSSFTGNLTIPNSVTAIGESAFSGCSGFSGSLTIGNSVSFIGQSAFAACNGFTGDLIIPNSVTSIGAYAFQSCSGFTGNLTISNSVTSIEVQTFRHCSGFNGNLTIGNSVTTIKAGAFDNCSGLSGNLIIPNSVTAISREAFRNCSGFTGNLTLPNSVTTIGREAFQNCSGLTGLLSIPNSMITIDQSVFENCSGLTNLIICNSLTTIGINAFNNCSGFTGDLIIPNSVTSIGMNAFCGCSGFTNMTIGNSLSAIGSLAFSNCSGLEQIIVASGNVYYDSRENCNAIIRTSNNEVIVGCKNTVIPSSVTSIGSRAFEGCSGLTSIEIPSFVNTIGESAFLGCVELEQILVLSGNTVFDSRENCNAIIRTNTNELVIGCKNTVIPNSVTSIGISAFSGCIGMTSIEIPNSVTSIGYGAFTDCCNLASVVISNSVTSIGDFAFYGCSGLTEIIMFGIIPPTLNRSINNVFESTNNCPIFVPYESLNVYKTVSSNGWWYYDNRIFPMSYKTIPAYNESNNHYRFIASPLVDSIAPTTVDNLITETAYDLYQFSPSDSLGEWQNYKAHTDDFKLVNGQGYLYANENEVNIIFKGEFNEDVTKEVNLVYDANDERKCFNLIGNPFPCNAYIDREYYVLTSDGTNIAPEPIQSTTPIPPCTAVFVKAVAEGEMVVFTRVVP